MSLWDRFKSKLGVGRAPLDQRASAVRIAPVEVQVDEAVLLGGAFVDKSERDEELSALASVGEPEGLGVEAAIGLLRRVRGTPRETEALTRALEANDAPPAVRVACAEMLAARGEESRALDLLARVTSVEALLLAADLHAAAGQLPRAIGAIERVLARQIDTPGARERHTRWVLALGIGRKERRHLDEATIVTARSSQGPYRLLREVARGGAGTVYEAEDDVLGRHVGFKVYHGEGGDRSAVEREIRLFARLSGRGVARVFDAAPDSGWIALEWVPRGSLRDVLLRDTAAELSPIAAWARPLAVALARVHREGFVHGDVKPANVLLRSVDDPVLTDFGIAKQVGEAQVGGSPGYLSPERLGGEASSCLDDVYGFGRIIEDVLERLDDPQRAFWEKVVHVCLGPASHRPMNGAQLAALVGADMASRPPL